MTKEREVLNEFMESCFYSILDSEKKALEPLAHGELTLKEIHLIDTVFKLKQIGQNNFSNVANKLGITLGTLTTAFSKLERKGYLKKEQLLVDMRVYYIIPTPLAKKIHEEHTKWHERLIDNVLNAVPEKDLQYFISAFKSLNELFKQKK